LEGIGENMAHQIVIIQQMGDALRNTGYKNIESAVAEIIDNSIEAKANDVLVLVSESTNSKTGRKYVTEFAFLDNGTGMDIEQLGSCLGIGSTSRSARRGMGRFGVGLPQSSLHVCPSVDVYSWQGGYENCHKVFLDIELVKTGEQVQIDDPVKQEIPKEYAKFLDYKAPDGQYDFTKNGTLIHWKKCDRVSPKTMRFLFNTLDFSLGRKFRYLIKDNTHNIRLIDVGNEDFYRDVMPNDPLFLMTPNFVLGNVNDPENIEPQKNTNRTEPLFEPYGNSEFPDGVVPIEVYYTDRDTREVKQSVVHVKFSKVRDVFYDKTAMPARDPGSTPMGKFAAKMEGISIVRAGREIDFGMFDFYKNINQPQHRWWGCEINFTPELDEAFGVANNKQQVELHELDTIDYDGEEVQPIWLQLYSVIHNTITDMYNKNKATREKTRTIEDIKSPVSEIINAAEINNDADSESGRVKEETPLDELIGKNKERLEEHGIEEPTEDDAITYMNNKVNITYKDSGRGPFFDYSFSLGSCDITINMSHIFYKKFFSEIETDTNMKTAFELYIAAFVKTIDEIVGDQQREVSDNIVSEWDSKLRKYISEQYGVGK